VSSKTRYHYAADLDPATPVVLASDYDAMLTPRKSPMSDDKPVRIDVELPPAEGHALAQFVKRVTWSGMRACAVDEAECYAIRAAIDTLQKALAEADYAPR
jgi:hypothetical protein